MGFSSRSSGYKRKGIVDEVWQEWSMSEGADSNENESKGGLKGHLEGYLCQR